MEYRAFNDETGQHEYYGTEEKATAAFWADIRYEWQRMEPQGSGAAWVPWAPTTTFEEHQAQQNRRWAAE